MTIRVERPRRKLVGWLRGQPPPIAASVLEEREFTTTSIGPEEILKIRVSSAIVMTLNAQEAGGLTKDLREHAGRILDLGCRILIRVDAGYEDLVASVVQNARLPATNVRSQFVVGQFSAVEPHILVATILGDDELEWRKLSQFLTQSDQEPVFDTPNLTGPRARNLSRTQRDLLTRAFLDCAEVRLSDMPQGRSGAEMLIAHPTMARPVLGDAAPLFVKFDERDRVAQEHNSYENHVRPFVPNHLGPHLVERRCCLGAEKGVLIGTYIEESESLLACATSGRSANVVDGLLTRTLAGWHRSGRIEETEYGSELARELPGEILEARFVEATRLGARLTLDELRERLMSVGSQMAWVGQVHGDLHAENVLARGADAVLIDFGKCTRGPLLLDLATLEASLLVGDVYAEIRAGQRVPHRTWRVAMAPMYTQAQLRRVPYVTKQGDPCAWLQASVRQIRLHAMNIECAPGQYARALGAALLRTASRRPGAKAAEIRRRAMAYVFGETLIMMEWT
jgi:hypothetical protein